MNSPFHQFVKKITYPFAFRFFLMRVLPAAFFGGLTIESINQECVKIAIQYSWFTKNPFKSIYFAIQAMAAEMCSGLLASAHLYKRNPGLSMLVVSLQVNYLKKATGKIIFSCEDGLAIKAAIESAIQTGEGTTVVAKSVGLNSQQERVSEFFITWSFKTKKNSHENLIPRSS